MEQHEKASNNKVLQARHGVVCRLAGQEEGYFGWPSITRCDDGRLIAVASGPRVEHVCPFGKTSMFVSDDDGSTWSPPRIINDSPIDDRDAGIVSLGGRGLLLSWFTVDSRRFAEHRHNWPDDQQARAEALLASWTDEMVGRYLGTWIMLSDDGGANWSEPIRVPVSTPHGPIRRAGGDLLYLGKRFGRDLTDRQIMACRSSDDGRTWQEMGAVPVAEGTRDINYHEAHVVELSNGRLVGMIRFQFIGEDDPARESNQIDFSMFQSASDDGGATWSPAAPTGIYGSPPHLIRHSCGKLVCVYGYRKSPTGQRAMISSDDGRTWDSDWIIRSDGPGGDLGYPCSVELADGSIFTVYYQKYAKGEPCSILWSRWRLPPFSTK